MTQCNTLLAWAIDEDLCDKLEQLQPSNQMLPQVFQRKAAESLDYTVSHDGGSLQV